MLTVTYAQCLADPTYCEDGKRGGAILIAQMGIKANQPIPLKDIFPHVTLKEALWCLRVCKKSQQTEARIVVWTFIHACVTMFPQTTNEDIVEYLHCKRDGKKYTTDKQIALMDRYSDMEHLEPTYKIARIACSDRQPSQVAIDVLEETLKFAVIHFDDHDAEMKLRHTFGELIK